ncbi:MFS transporter [Euryarchaeota archaeon ex4484_178]|nr:MAG: MFS transporter [Euryarchaeota archaeon ex4484_178]
MRKQGVYISIMVIPIFGGLAAQLLRIVIAFTLRDFGLTVFEITILSSTFMLARGLSAPLIGRLGDKGWSRYLIVSLGFLGLGIDSVLYLIVPYPYMIGLRALDGIYGAMAWTTMQAWVHMASPGKYKGRLMSSYFMMGGLGASIGYIFYNILLGNAYYAVLTVATFYIISILFSTPFRGINQGEKKKEIEQKSSGHNASLYSLSFLYGMFFSLGAEVLWFYLAETMGFGRANTTFFLSIVTFIAIFGTFLMGHISDKRGFRYTLWVLGLLALLSGFFLMLNFQAIVLVATLIFYVAGRGFMPISRSFAASRTKNIGTSLGFVNFSSNIGSVVAPLIGGFLYDLFSPYHIFVFNLGAFLFFVLGISIFVNTYILNRMER